MPAKGKHRRPKSNPITRGFVAAGTGGAAIALPLIGATGAHAAGSTTPAAAPEKAVTASSFSSASSAAAAPAAQKNAAPTVYSVVSGDFLSKIADEHDVRGGWQKLYQDNREVVGDDPSLIHPGLKITIGAKSKAKAPERAEPKAESKPESKPEPKPRSEKKAKSSPNSAADSASSSAPQPSSNDSGSGAARGSGFTAPVDGASISTAYRASGAMWSSGYHTGVDFAAASGTSVKSVGAGTVVSAGWGGSYGNEVVIQHSDGSYSQYAHLSSLSVSSGESVTGGQQIGLSGSTGNSSGPHLHFEIRTGPSYGSDVDPLAYLRQHGVSI
ncbi:LysM peptidoglycan-binding domain-containing M23 family metallopeptidase [Streptomyces sp. NBC_01142]|uniref:M23 family metallopeptidase n=1 Tax=Streptomyces sp. NBC_01142 TaxID=2975865 RepID=UPI00225411B9|nr:M23 family metallopeptidase [Streptomyces sp. NBC_01142]MCX4820714.1 LysM peptidoglycan-binding domain-containing M23 family metallopeptidase [Streptomyces sp. NBC_01142]